MGRILGKVTTPQDDLTYKVIGLFEDGIAHQTEYRINVNFRDKHVGAFELDFVVRDQIVVELKAVATLAPIHKQQAISYLAASGLPVALLINFGGAKLEYQRLFPPRAVQSSAAYQARRPITNPSSII